MAGRLAGKVAVVTGAGSGIGAATVEAFRHAAQKCLSRYFLAPALSFSRSRVA